jgi:hypothetical protein
MKPPREVILSCTEWLNLLNALKTEVERHGLEAVEEALDHLKNTGIVQLSGRIKF